MSVAAMADNKLLREASAQVQDRDQPDPGTVRLPEGGRVIGVNESPLNAVIQWIPAETIGAYIFIQQLVLDPLEPAAGQQIHQLDFTGRWIVFLIGAALTLASVPLACAVKAKLASTDFKVPVLETIIALVAFVLWAIALPESPLYDFSVWEPKFGVAAIAASAVFLNPLAILIGINTKWTKAVAQPKADRAERV